MADDVLAMFRESLRRFLLRHASPGDARRMAGADSSFDRDVWHKMCRDLGLPGLAVPEDDGGQGFGSEALAVACHELGRALYGTPFLSTVLAAAALVEAANPTSRRQLLVDALSGSKLMCLAMDISSHTWTDSPVLAHEADDAVVLSGEVRHVLDAPTADVLVVPARTSGNVISLFAVAPVTGQVVIEPTLSVDRSRSLATVRFDGAIGSPLSTGNCVEALGRVRSLALLCVAAEASGGIERVTETAVGYAVQRFAFGRQIGSFQAVKHRCAEMWMAQVSAAALVRAAAEAFEARDDSATVRILLAKATATDAYASAAVDNSVVHGGIGFTWESDAHLYVRRAHALAIMLGDSGACRREAFDLVLTEFAT